MTTTFFFFFRSVCFRIIKDSGGVIENGEGQNSETLGPDPGQKHCLAEDKL